MKSFFFRAKNKKNEITEGHINASDFVQAAKELEKEGYIVLEIKEKIKENSIIKSRINISVKKIVLSLQEKKEFFNAFYFMYKSGLSINQIFSSILSSSKNVNIKNLCFHINKNIEKGNSLKESMTPFSNIIGKAYTMLIIAGEESGKLESVLSDIIKNISREEELHKNIVSSLTYPACVVCLAIAVFFLFKFFVLKVFALMGDGITQTTVMCILTTAVIKIIIIFAIIGGMLFYIFKNKKLQQKISGRLFSFKIFSGLLKNYYFTNFFFVTALAYDAGISAGEAVNLANSVINIKEINTKIKKSADMILNGCKVGTALGAAGLFSSYAISQISSGEEAGELDKIFRIVSADYENKLDLSLKVIIKLVEPILLIFVGIIVLNIAINAYKSYYAGLFSIF